MYYVSQGGEEYCEADLGCTVPPPIPLLWKKERLLYCWPRRLGQVTEWVRTVGTR